MTALHKKLRTGLTVLILLIASHDTNAASAADTCRMEDKLPLALERAQQHEREPGEFAGVEIVAGSFERTQIVDDVFEYTFLLKVSPGEHDLIRLHRVMREKTPCKPLSLGTKPCSCSMVALG